MYPSRSTWSHSSKPRPHRLAAAIVASLLASCVLPLFLSADQEGGQMEVLGDVVG